MKKIAVTGIGNLLMQDDGAGIHVINRLQELNCLPEMVDLIDAGVNSYDMVDVFCAYDYLLIVDAMQAGGVPGTIYRAPLEELGLQPDNSITSLHEMHFIEAVNMVKLMGHDPEIMVFGIEPEAIRINIGLSASVEEKIPRLIELIRNEIDRIINI